MSPTMLTFSVGSFALLALCLAGSLAPAVRAAAERMPRTGLAARLALALAIALSAAALFRPHQYTFAGLDTTAYRMMAHAFANGRGMSDVDRLLLEVPPDLRPWTLFAPGSGGKYTRDITFQITSLEDGSCRPFFYPLLPLTAAGFDALVPGRAADYLMPLVGFGLFLLFFLRAFSWAGGFGVLMAAALLFGSPLPVWLFRGYIPECVSTALIAGVLLAWLSGGRRPLPWLSAFGLGLAASYHPLMVLPAGGVLLLLALSQGSPRRAAADVALFALGVVPLLAMTRWTAQPYGDLSWAALAHNFHASPSHRIALTAASALALATPFLLLIRRLWLPRAAGVLAKPWPAALIWLAAWAVPTAAVIALWSEGRFVYSALRHDFVGGLQLPLLALLVATAGAALLSRGHLRAKALLALAAACLPVFLYLAGKEHVDMWSQRRLLTPLLMAGAALLAPAAALCEALAARRAGRMPVVAVPAALLLCAVAAHNVIRWPAPYRVRFEGGADPLVQRLSERMGQSLVVFDYHPYSIPFAACGEVRALSIHGDLVFRKSSNQRRAFRRLIAWMRGRALREEVLVASAYANPGLEEGLRLEEIAHEAVKLPYVIERSVLPAERHRRTLEIRLLRAVPLAPGDSPPSLHKTMDGGPLALGGPWGPGEIRLTMADGAKRPARWSRQGSGVVGPVPPPGGTAVVTLVAGSSQDGDQRMRLAPPWDPAGETAVVFSVPPKGTTITLALPRGQAVCDEPTGTYTFTSPEPYDPARDGIEGFDPDLGILIHSVSIAAQGPGTNAPSASED